AGGRFLAPDNGLLTAALGAPGARAVAVTRDDLYAPAASATFHGRDRFAPIAAAWLGGAAVTSLGAPHPSPVRLALPLPRRDGAALVGRVAHVDRFGNLVTDVPASWLAGRDFRVELAGRSATRRVTHFAELEPEEPGWMIGSLGTLEVALRGAS